MRGDCISDNEGINARDAEERQSKGPSTYLHAGASKVGWPYDHSVEDAYEVPPYIWHAPYHDWQEDTLSDEPVKVTDHIDHIISEAKRKFDQWQQYDASDKASEVAAQEAFLKQMTTIVSHDPPEYAAEFGSKGEALLVKSTKSTTRSVQFIGAFETMADAQKAAEALNEHEGY